MVYMEFSTIGCEDSVEEATTRLQNYDVLIVWGEEDILGVITVDHLDKKGTCGEICELDVLVDPSLEMREKWNPKYVIKTEDGEPVSIVNHQ